MTQNLQIQRAHSDVWEAAPFPVKCLEEISAVAKWGPMGAASIAPAGGCIKYELSSKVGFIPFR